MTKKTLLIVAVVIISIVAILFIQKINNTPYELVAVQTGDMVQEVSASGKVESPTKINLHFKNSGKLFALNAKVGEEVATGELLAVQDTAQLDAQVAEMQSGIDLQRAKLAQLIAGASEEETTVSETALANAKRDYENVKAAQEVLVKNAYKTLLNSTISAVPVDDTSKYVAPTITGNYSLGKEGTINISPYRSSGGTSFRISGLVEGVGTNDEIIAQPIANSGLYIKFTDTNNLSSTDWVINIPNKDAPNYIQNYNAYQSALQTQQSTLASAQSLVDLREAELIIKKAPTRPTDIAVYQVQINQAEAALQKIYAQREDLMIVAPASSTVTEVNGEVGETVNPATTIVSLATGGLLQIKINIVEDSIVDVRTGQKVRIIFDAIKNQEFEGTVASINPAETIIGGTVYYETVITFDKADERIRSGMTANVWIETNVSENTLFIPVSAVRNKDGKMTVQVLDGEQVVNKEVVTGIKNNVGMIEIVSGLAEGDQIILGKAQ